MKKSFFTILLLFFSVSTLTVFAGNGNGTGTDEGSDPGKEKPRKIVERLFQGTNISLNKDLEETTMFFHMVPGDSIRITCGDCYKLMDPDNKKGSFTMALRTDKETKVLSVDDLDKWVGVDSEKKGVKVVFQRDGSGSKVLDVRQIRVWRKTDE